MQTLSENRWAVVLNELVAAASIEEFTIRVRDCLNIICSNEFLFISATMAQEKRQRYEYVVGCDPSWAQQHVSRNWFLIDPLLEYAKTKYDPIYASELNLNTTGQATLFEEARRKGFEDALIVPTICPLSQRVGMLALIIKDPGEKQVLHAIGSLFGNNYLKMLGQGILYWLGVKRHESAVNARKLNERHLAVMRLLHAGVGNAHDIAALMCISVPAVYSLFSQINERLGTNRITASMDRAEEIGLLFRL